MGAAGGDEGEAPMLKPPPQIQCQTPQCRGSGSGRALGGTRQQCPQKDMHNDTHSSIRCQETAHVVRLVRAAVASADERRPLTASKKNPVYTHR
jgi:hypothetical protein